MAMEMAMELGMGSHQAWMGAPWVFALCYQYRGQGVEVKRPKWSLKPMRNLKHLRCPL